MESITEVSHIAFSDESYYTNDRYRSVSVVTFENGNKMVINAPENNANTRYIESMTLNGKNYTKNYLKHADLQNGGEINIRMSETPNKQRGIQTSDFPYSFSVNEKK